MLFNNFGFITNATMPTKDTRLTMMTETRMYASVLICSAIPPTTIKRLRSKQLIYPLATDNRVKLPIIVVNCKAYENCIGDKAIRIAEICERVAKATGVTIAIAVDAADIYHVKMAARIPVFAQHVDADPPGAHTGSILPEAVEQAGAVGTILNHSEKKLALPVLQKSIARARHAGLATLACAATPKEAADIAALKPDFIAIEPPELIGGDISVSTAKPEVITATTKLIAQIPVLCGAGIKTKNDAAKAVALGAQGILVASGVTLAKNPEQVLKDFAAGLRKA